MQFILCLVCDLVELADDLTGLALDDGFDGGDCDGTLGLEVAGVKFLQDVVEEGMYEDVLLLDVATNVDAVDVSADVLDIGINRIELQDPLGIHSAKHVLGLLVVVDLHIPGNDRRGVATNGLELCIRRMSDLDLGIVGKVNHNSLMVGDVGDLHAGHDNIYSGVLALLKMR